MATCLGKSCSFSLPRVPFVNCCQFMCLVISLLVLKEGYGIWLYQFLIIAYLFTFDIRYNFKSDLSKGSLRYFHRFLGVFNFVTATDWKSHWSTTLPRWCLCCQLLITVFVLSAWYCCWYVWSKLGDHLTVKELFTWVSTRVVFGTSYLCFYSFPSWYHWRDMELDCVPYSC